MQITGVFQEKNTKRWSSNVGGTCKHSQEQGHIWEYSFPTIVDPILNDFSESGADSSTETIWEFQVWRLSLSRHLEKNKSGS